MLECRGLEEIYIEFFDTDFSIFALPAIVVLFVISVLFAISIISALAGREAAGSRGNMLFH